MKYNNIVDFMRPFAHWTCENYTQDNSTLLPRIGNTPIINNGATFGSLGQNNTNFSSKSINLKDGEIYLDDPSFFFDKMFDSSNWFISLFFFCGFTREQSVTGTILRQMNGIETLFSIRFDGSYIFVEFNGLIGDIQFQIYEPYIIYNKQWNHFVLHYTDDNTLSLVLNGTVYGYSSGTYRPKPVGADKITFGDVGDGKFNSDFYISEIVFAKDINKKSYFSLATMRLCHSDYECILKANPDLYFDVNVDYYDGKCVFDNLSVTGQPIQIYLSGHNEWPRTTAYRTEEKQIAFPVDNCRVQLTDDYYLNHDGGNISFFINGGTSDVNGRYTYTVTLRNDNGDYHFYQRYENNDKRVYQWIREDGSTHNFLDYFYSNFINSEYEHHIVNIHNNFTAADTIVISNNHPWSQRSYSSSHSTPMLLGGDPYKISKNSFFAESFMKFGKFCVFNYYMTTSKLAPLMCDRTLARFWLMTVEEPRSIRMYTWWGKGHIAENDSKFNYSESSSTSYRKDENNNRLEYHSVVSKYLNSSSNYIKEYDWYASYFRSDDFTIAFCIGNVNADSMYVFFNRVYASESSTRNLAIKCNCYNNSFLLGAMSFTVHDGDATQTIDTKNIAIPDNGFHNYAFIRRGYFLEVWVDGVLVNKKLTPSKYHVGNDQYYHHRLNGGPVYVSELVIYYWWAAPQSFITMLNFGYSDYMKGQTILNDEGVQSRVYLIDRKNEFDARTKLTDENGKFEWNLPKKIGWEGYDVATIPLNNATNHLVVHGGYCNSIIESRGDYNVFGNLPDFILNLKPLMFYEFNENTEDSSPNNNDCTLIGNDYSYPTSFYDSELHDIKLDDSYLQLPNGFSNLQSGFTIALWFKIDNLAQSSSLFRIASSDTGLDSVSLDISNDDITYRVKTSDQSVMSLAANNILTAGAWYNLIVRSEIDGTVSIFGNGVLISTNVLVSPNLIERNHNFLFNSSSVLQGTIGYFAFYSYPLNIEAIEIMGSLGFLVKYESFKQKLLEYKPISYYGFDYNTFTIDDLRLDHELIFENTPNFTTGCLKFDNDLKCTIPNSILSVPSTLMFTFKITFGNSGTLLEFDTENGLIILKMIDNKLRTEFYDENTYVESTFTNDGAWHLLAIIINDNNYQLYVDGELDCTTDVTLATQTTDISFGLLDNLIIDDLAIFDKDQSSIQTHLVEYFNKKRIL
jgi:hypothetical protein